MKLNHSQIGPASSRMGRYVPAPAVQRLTPQRQSARYRNWSAVDVRGVTYGDVLSPFGDTGQAQKLFDRLPTGGRPRVNPELLARLVVAGAVLGLSYRRLEGLGLSVARLLGVELGLAPDHSTINKWVSDTDYQKLSAWLVTVTCLHTPVVVSVAVDATGLAVRASGGWVADKPGGLGTRLGKYDKWHVVCDTQTGFVLEWALTRSSGSGSGDVSVGPSLITAVGRAHPSVAVVCADGAYPSTRMFEACTRVDAALLVPLRAAAVYTGLRSRDQLLTQQSRIGLGVWKQRSGYHQRSQIENTFSVSKTLWGNRLRHHSVSNREVEVAVQVVWRNLAIMEGLKM